MSCSSESTCGASRPFACGSLSFRALRALHSRFWGRIRNGWHPSLPLGALGLSGYFVLSWVLGKVVGPCALPGAGRQWYGRATHVAVSGGLRAKFARRTGPHSVPPWYPKVARRRLASALGGPASLEVPALGVWKKLDSPLLFFT